jgi:ribosomal protein S18 acetylase RimI-like enzyme
MRPATTADVPALLTLVSKYWEFERLSGFDEVRVARELRRLLSDAALGNVWIATDGPKPVGYLIAVYVFSLEHLGLTAEIDELFVLPEYRGNGLGSRLLQAAESEFAERGCTNVFLQIGRENGSARRFYREQGFGERAGFEMLDKMLSHKS